jgi:tetratricopeptide (TPR) repeat protein
MLEFSDLSEWFNARSELIVEEFIQQCLRAHEEGSFEHFESNLILPEQLERLTSYCLEQKRFPEAIAVASLWTTLAPYSAEGWDQLGMAYVSAGLPQKAVEAFQRALACNPSDNELILHLAIAYAEAGIVAEAEAHFDFALILDPLCEDAIWQKAIFAQHRGYYRDAIELYERLADSPRYAQDALFELGYCYDCC